MEGTPACGSPSECASGRTNDCASSPKGNRNSGPRRPGSVPNSCRASCSVVPRPGRWPSGSNSPRRSANSYVADVISLYGSSGGCSRTMMFVFCWVSATGAAASGFATARSRSGWGKSVEKLSFADSSVACSKSRNLVKEVKFYISPSFLIFSI